MSFEQDRLSVWTAWLIEEWERAAEELRGRKVELQLPHFHINPRCASRYGQWDSGRRMIEVAERVFTEFPKAAMVDVLRHEVAHQVVSEYFHADGVEPPHGAKWKIACGWLGADASVSSCDEVLGATRADPDTVLRDKVRKLMAHGECDGATAAESETFLAKARSLMMRHNLELADLERDAGGRAVYVQRPVGRLFKRLPGYYHELGRLLNRHYFVNYLQTHTRIVVGGAPVYFTRIELFGERENVDAAAFVCHELLRQAEYRWWVYRRGMKGANRRSFFMGLFEGFGSTLEAERAGVSEEDLAIMLREETRRTEAWRAAYPRVRWTRAPGASGASRAAGMAAGKGLRIGRRRKLLE